MGHIDHETLAASQARQIEEARSPDNRYFFGLAYPTFVRDNDRQPNEDELMMYYIDNGGASGHRQRMETRAADEQRAAS